MILLHACPWLSLCISKCRDSLRLEAAGNEKLKLHDENAFGYPALDFSIKLRWCMQTAGQWYFKSAQNSDLLPLRTWINTVSHNRLFFLLLKTFGELSSKFHQLLGKNIGLLADFARILKNLQWVSLFRYVAGRFRFKEMFYSFQHVSCNRKPSQSLYSDWLGHHTHPSLILLHKAAGCHFYKRNFFYIHIFFKLSLCCGSMLWNR